MNDTEILSILIEEKKNQDKKINTTRKTTGYYHNLQKSLTLYVALNKLASTRLCVSVFINLKLFFYHIIITHLSNWIQRLQSPALS